MCALPMPCPNAGRSRLPSTTMPDDCRSRLICRPIAALCIGAAMMVVGTSGCSSGAGESEFNPRSAAGAGAWIEQQASLELARSTPPADVPVPPGVASFTLRESPLASSTANAPLDETLAYLASSLDWPPGDPPEDRGPLTTQQRDEALKLYARGRDALMASRYYEAATALGAALDRDPRGVPIMQLLARTYTNLRGRDKAVDMWRLIVHIEPDHPEANFELALAAADQQDSATSIGIIARARLNGVQFSHDPAAPLLADFAMVYGLRQMGYDRAAVEVGESLINSTTRSTKRYRNRLTSVLQQLGEVQTHIGDALSRLGQPERAIAVYAAAAERPLPDPGALFPRVIHINARLGRFHSAQFELLSAIRSSEPHLPIRLILLAEYLRDLGRSTDTLVRAVREHAGTSDNAAALTRIEARLVRPLDGAARIEAAMRRIDRDTNRDLWRTLAADQIALLAEADPQRAILRAARFMRDVPDDAESFALVLAANLPDPAAGADIAKSASGSDAPAMLRLLQARLLMSMDAYGEAWRVLDNAADDSMNAVVLRTQMEIAARLNEPQLLEELTIAAAVHDDVRTWMARSAAWRTIGELARAQHAADRAVDRANEADRVEARIEQAGVHLAFAAAPSTSTEKRRQHAEDAAAILERVIEMHPTALRAAELLTSLYGPNGLLQSAERYREVARRVFEHGRSTASFLRLAALENLNRQRTQQALELALTLAEYDATDAEALDVAVRSYAALNRLDEGIRWIDTQLTKRPGNPALLERRIQLLVAAERLPEAVTWLQAQRTEQPGNVALARLLEQAARQHGAADLASDLALERLSQRPEGIRRHLELAAHHTSRGEVRGAISEIDAVLATAAIAQRQQMINAVGVLDRCRTEWRPQLDEQTQQALSDALRRAAEQAIDHDPTMPLQIYGMVLRDMAEREQIGASFERIAARAVANAPGAGRPGARESLVWRDLAQALVEAGHSNAAAKVIRVRLMSDPLPDPVATTILARIAVAVDASIGGRADATRSLLEQLHAAERAPVWNSAENPTFAQSCYEASLMYSLTGDDQGMIMLLQAAVEAGSTNAMAFNNLGYYLLENVHTPAEEAEAEQLLVAAYRQEPADPNIADSLGYLRYLQGFLEDFINTDPSASEDELRLPGALTLIEQSIAAGEAEDGIPSAEVYEHYGDALWRTEQHDQAADAWQRAYDLLADTQRTQTIIRNYELVQSRVWGIRVFDPEQRQQEQTEPDRQRVRAKIEAARKSASPSIAPTFAERRAQRVASDEPEPADGD